MIVQRRYVVLLSLLFITMISVIKYTNLEANWNSFIQIQHHQIMEVDIQIHSLNDISNYHDFNATFFVETSNAKYLNHRQSCCVEAAARAQHPHLVIIYMTGVEATAIKEENAWIRNFTNIKIVHLESDKFFTSKNLGRIYREVKNKTSVHMTEHISDLARIALLKKFGGLYIDTDTALMKSTTHFEPFILRNFANGIIKCRTGDIVIEEMHRRLSEFKYNPKLWSGLGEILIERIAIDICNFNKKAKNFEEAGKKCNTTFLDIKAFLPVYWGKWEAWKELFRKDIEIEKFEVESMQAAYAIHFSNYLTSDSPVIKGRKQIFE